MYIVTYKIQQQLKKVRQLVHGMRLSTFKHVHRGAKDTEEVKTEKNIFWVIAMMQKKPISEKTYDFALSINTRTEFKMPFLRSRYNKLK